jgi:hypothetical protein
MASPFDCRLLQPRVLRFAFLEERDVRIGALPELQEVFVGYAGLRGITFKRVCARQSEVGHRGERELRTMPR